MAGWLLIAFRPDQRYNRVVGNHKQPLTHCLPKVPEMNHRKFAGKIIALINNDETTIPQSTGFFIFTANFLFTYTGKYRL